MQQTNEQPLGSVRSLSTDQLKDCDGDKQRRETIEKLGDDESQIRIDVVNCRSLYSAEYFHDEVLH